MCSVCREDCLYCDFLSHTCLALYWLFDMRGLDQGQTTPNKTHRDRALAEWQKATAGFTARAFTPAGHYVTSPVTSRPSFRPDWYQSWSAEGVPNAFSDAARVPEEEPKVSSICLQKQQLRQLCDLYHRGRHRVMETTRSVKLETIHIQLNGSF